MTKVGLQVFWATFKIYRMNNFKSFGLRFWQAKYKYPAAHRYVLWLS